MKAIIALLLLSNPALAGGLIYQGATASLSSTPSLVTYTTKVTPLTQPNYTWVPGSNNTAPIFKDVAPVVEDNGYANGIYTCAVQGTFSVNANAAVTGTIAVNSTMSLSIQTGILNGDGSTTWTNFKTEGAGPTTGLGKAFGKVSNLVPCTAGGFIRIMAATNILQPVLTTVPDENSLTIVKIF